MSDLVIHIDPDEWCVAKAASMKSIGLEPQIRFVVSNERLIDVMVVDKRSGAVYRQTDVGQEKCPGCGDGAIRTQLDGLGDLVWILDGVDDREDPSDIVTISFCPYCGIKLEDFFP